MSALYENTCVWDSPPPGTPPGCTAEMEKLCGGAKSAGVKSYETCCVANAATLMTEPQTGTYYSEWRGGVGWGG